MDYAVIGGDERFACLTQLLCSCGYDARAIGLTKSDLRNLPKARMEDLPQAKNAVMNWPVQGGDAILTRLSEGTKAYFCGPGIPERVPDGIDAVNLWADERLLVENAWLTAEGAVSAAMNTCRKALKDCHCMIIGWGRIGRALTEILVGMNVRTTVASRSEKGRCCANERGAESVSTYNVAKALPGKDIVFSTPPDRVLGERELQQVDRNVMIIDLSSAPHGVDLEATNRLGLKCWREPGLPGRYCPVSAAMALLQAMIRSERKERV